MGLVSNGDRCPLYPRKWTFCVASEISAARCYRSHPNENKENNDREGADQQYLSHVVTGHPSTRLVCALNNAIVFDVRHFPNPSAKTYSARHD